MADLVIERSRPSRHFFYTGINYLGPFFVRQIGGRGNKTYKMWISTFVCYSTRSVHLELVMDYSTKSFIAALERFLSRRRIPAQIVSDNGTNFVGADRELRNTYNRIIKSDE